MELKGQDQNYAHFFDSLIGINNLGIVSGFEYEYPKFAEQSHPYLLENYWLYGDISISNSVYYNIPLRYDLLNQQVVIRKIKKDGSSFPVVLDNNRIDWIKVQEQLFVKIDDQPYWLFEQHYKGTKLGLYELHLKKQNVDQVNYSFNYKSNNRLYLMIESKLVDYKGLKSITNQFPESKNQIRKYVKDQGLKVSSKLSDIKTLLSFCENL